MVRTLQSGGSKFQVANVPQLATQDPLLQLDHVAVVSAKISTLHPLVRVLFVLSSGHS